MSTSLEDIARQVVAATDNDAGYVLAAQWVLNRYIQLSTRVRLRHLRQVGELYLPATVSTGTATLTRDSATVSFDATATTALYAAGVRGNDGWFIRGAVAWYEIIELVGTTTATATLLAKYAEDNVSAGAYTVCRRYIPVAVDARWIGPTMVHMRRRLPIQRCDAQELDLIASSRPRIATGNGPDVWAEVTPDPQTNGKRVELYPYTSQSEVIHYIYWPTVPTYKITDPLPPSMDSYSLKEGALIDMFRYLMSKAAKNGQADIAAFWRNESRAQETKWEQYIRELIKADRGDDDATFILRRAGVQTRSFDIQTALDEVYSRWPR